MQLALWSLHQQQETPDPFNVNSVLDLLRVSLFAAGIVPELGPIQTPFYKCVISFPAKAKFASSAYILGCKLMEQWQLQEFIYDLFP